MLLNTYKLAAGVQEGHFFMVRINLVISRGHLAGQCSSALPNTPREPAGKQKYLQVCMQIIAQSYKKAVSYYWLPAGLAQLYDVTHVTHVNHNA